MPAFKTFARTHRVKHLGGVYATTACRHGLCSVPFLCLLLRMYCCLDSILSIRGTVMCWMGNGSKGSFSSSVQKRKMTQCIMTPHISSASPPAASTKKRDEPEELPHQCVYPQTTLTHRSARRFLTYKAPNLTCTPLKNDFLALNNSGYLLPTNSSVEEWNCW